MRVKLSGPVEMVEALEAALQSTPNAVLEAPLMRRENAELRFGVTEIADIIGIVKDFAELVSLCWAGIQILRGLSAKRREVPVPAEFEVTTAGAHVRVVIPLESTRQQIGEHLAPLRRTRVS